MSHNESNLNLATDTGNVTITVEAQRTHAEQSIRQNEEHYRTLFDSMDEGCCIIEMIFDEHDKPVDWLYLEINPAFEKVTGMAEVLGKRIHELVPALEQSWFELYGKVALTGEPIRFANEVKPLHRWFDVYVVRIGDPDDRKVAVFFNNITDRKQIETALHESEARYRTLFNSIDEGFCIIEMLFDAHDKPVDYRFEEVNPTFERQTGLLNATEKRMRELVPDLEAHWFEIYGKVALTGTAVRFVNEAKPMGGRWFDIYACRVGGPDSRKVAIVFNDITQRRQSDNALRISEERYRTLFNSMDEGYCIIELMFNEHGEADDYRFLEVNPAFEKQTGLHAATGKRMRELVPDQAAVWSEIYAKVALTGTPIRFKSEAKVLDRWFDIYAFRIGGSQSKKVAVIFNNVNERKQFELNLKEATDIAEQANRAKTDFISRMSHELRTPLNAILGFAQLMESGSPAPVPSQKRSLDQILKGGWYLLDLINEILDLALIESGKMPMLLEPVSLNEVMAECEILIEPQAQKRGIGMTFAQIDVPSFVTADRTRLKQVFINLLSNAIKYNRPGGTVAVECTQNVPNSIRISVRDTGEGLAAKQLAQLFQPFNRLGKENSAEEGTGIGLMMTKRLVELMGGVIGADSVLGIGSLFWFELNLAEAPPLAADETKARVRSPVPDGTPLSTLLYVEDNPANLELIEQVIARRSDLRLLSATDGNRGIELAHTHLPQVILMDVNLPGLSGIEIMNILRADPSTAHIPIIALSANAMPYDIEQGLESGFFSYLTKPIKVIQFMDALEMALDFSKTKSNRLTPKVQACQL